MPTLKNLPVDGITSWHSCQDKAGRTIHYITSRELGVGTGIVSISDPQSGEPARRLVAPAWRAEGIAAEDLPGSGKGLTLFGRHKGDRPSLAAMLSLDPAAARAVIDDCVRIGRGYEDALVFEAARKSLRLSQADLGIALDMAAGNNDAGRRRQNVGRTIRRYETDGAPVVAAHALRWLCLRAGVIALDRLEREAE